MTHCTFACFLLYEKGTALMEKSANMNMPGLMPMGGLGNDDNSPIEPPPEPTDQNPKHLFTCCVCRVFVTIIVKHRNLRKTSSNVNAVTVNL